MHDDGRISGRVLIEQEELPPHRALERVEWNPVVQADVERLGLQRQFVGEGALGSTPVTREVDVPRKPTQRGVMELRSAF
jgi:hypothetical protein